MLVTISVVSHGHAEHIKRLMDLLARSRVRTLCRVWLTLNVPEPGLADISVALWPFDLRVVVNESPKGFGANHNKVFTLEKAEISPSRWFCVLNPDLTWKTDPFPALLSALKKPQVGCSYPVQLDTQGRAQDHRRALPSPSALLHRHLSFRPEANPIQVDWVNAAFLMFPSSVFAELGGFDTRYFMYCEDVDLCIRLQLAGYRLIEAPKALVTHDASRASRRNLRHFRWHLTSLIRLWFSKPFRAFHAFRVTSTIQP